MLPIICVATTPGEYVDKLSHVGFAITFSEGKQGTLFYSVSPERSVVSVRDGILWAGPSCLAPHQLIVHGQESGH